MNISQLVNKSLKHCQFVGCTNEFYGTSVQKFCKDERCIQARRLANKNKYKDVDYNIGADNLKISNKACKRLSKGKLIHVRCRAKNSDGHRCKNKFTILYEPKIKTYAKFCEEHRSQYKRDRFAKI